MVVVISTGPPLNESTSGVLEPLDSRLPHAELAVVVLDAALEARVRKLLPRIILPDELALLRLTELADALRLIGLQGALVGALPRLA